MNADVAGEVRALRGMTIRDLRAKWQEVFGEGTRSGNRQHRILERMKPTSNRTCPTT